MQDRYTDLCSTRNTFQSKDDSLSSFDQHLVNIFNANKIPCTNGQSAIFPTASRINHDCTPNVFTSTRTTTSDNNNNSRAICNVHAIRPITAGEELVSAYTDICQGDDERARTLSQLFRCKCRLCDNNDNDKHDNGTITATAIKSFFRNRNRSRLALLKAILQDEDAVPIVIDKAGTEMIELMEMEGLVGVELGFALVSSLPLPLFFSPSLPFFLLPFPFPSLPFPSLLLSPFFPSLLSFPHPSLPSLDVL